MEQRLIPGTILELYHIPCLVGGPKVTTVGQLFQKHEGYIFSKEDLNFAHLLEV